jgi:thiol-disulfide isomerase/thioredoxin
MWNRRLAAIAAACLLGLATDLAAKSPLDVANASQRPRLRTIYSSDVDLQQLVRKNKSGIVLVFLGTECPVARLYIPTLAAMHQEFRGQGFQFLGIYSDVGVNVQEMAIHAHDEDIPFPVLQDVEHRLADLLQAQVTPEVVVLDAKLEKQYQGAIDNQYQRHGRKPAATETYLHDALSALASGKPVEVSSVPASGCPLERRTLARSTRELSYHKDVAPLVQQHCQGCHRQGGPGPFELITFDDVAGNAEKIREVVSDRRMPPWHGILDPQFGKLRNDQSLPEEALETIVDWIDGGAAEGNRSDAPPPRKWPAPHEWAIGKPDFVYRMPQPFVVPRSGTLEYQFFRVRMDSPVDRWFRGVEIKPGSPEVVHHVALHVAPATKPDRNEGLAMMAQLYGINGEKAHLINDFVPGDTYNAKVYPPDQAVLIPKHSDLIFELHYTPNGRAQRDQSMVAFQWADGPPQDEVLTTVFRKAIGRFRIPPHDPHYRVEDTYHFAHDVEIDAIRPHFHLRGKSFRLEMIERDPATDEIVKRQTILSVPIFDQAWQRTYELATPLVLPAGTELIATGHYDNSDLNPNNPDPSVEVTWGQQTTDEMFSTRFKYRVVKPAAVGGEG